MSAVTVGGLVHVWLEILDESKLRQMIFKYLTICSNSSEHVCDRKLDQLLDSSGEEEAVSCDHNGDEVPAS